MTAEGISRWIEDKSIAGNQLWTGPSWMKDETWNELLRLALAHLSRPALREDEAVRLLRDYEAAYPAGRLGEAARVFFTHREKPNAAPQDDRELLPPGSADAQSGSQLSPAGAAPGLPEEPGIVTWWRECRANNPLSLGQRKFALEYIESLRTAAEELREELAKAK